MTFCSGVPKWLSAQLFQSDYLLTFPKWLSAQDIHDDFLLNIKVGTLKVSQSAPQHIYILHALWGPKKWLKHTQNPSRMSFRVLIFPLVLAKKGPQWPPKGNPHNLESYYGSLNRIWLASERWHQNSIIRIMMLSFFDRLWPSWEFPMCNLDMWGVFSGVKFNSKLKLFYGLWQINASIKI